MKSGWETLRFQWARHQIRQRRADLYYELSSSLYEHVPLVTTLRKYEQRARARGSDQRLVYLEMLRGLQSGALSAAMQQVASPLELTLIDATQAAGDLSMAEGLEFLSENVRKLKKTRELLVTALTYPILLVSIFASMLVAFALVAVPVLVELLPPENWPLLGRMLYVAAQVLTEYGAYVLAAVLVALLALALSLPRWSGPLRRRFDEHFPYSLYRDYVSAIFLMALASMMRSGVSLRTALQKTQQFASPWLRWHIRRILHNLARPNTPYFGQAFLTGVLNVAMSDKVQDASERRDPVQSFIRAGSLALDDMNVIIVKRSKTINTVLIMGCGVVLALMFAGFFSVTMAIQSGMKSVS